jgi:hypothetical protein
MIRGSEAEDGTMAKRDKEGTSRSAERHNPGQAQKIDLDFDDIVAVAIADIVTKNHKKRRFKSMGSARARRP